jgi:hypothetical protein
MAAAGLPAIEQWFCAGVDRRASANSTLIEPKPVTISLRVRGVLAG